LDIQEYIASGILELYASRSLPPHEEAEVERMAALYPEVKEELDAIVETLETYAKLYAVEPPAHLREKIINQLSVAEFNKHVPPTRAAHLDAPVFKQIQMPEAVEPVERKNSYSWLAIAASVLLLISAGLNVYFYNNWQTTENRYQVAVASQNQYAQNIQRVQQKLQLTSSELAMITHHQTRRVNLQGVKKSPKSAVLVFWNANTKEVLLKVADLPAPPSGHQYQLWALENGKPIDAGILKVGSDSLGVQKMKTINNAQAFAITLEPQGGSKSPTLDEMYVMGQI
jgi:hypothetical protein